MKYSFVLILFFCALIGSVSATIVIPFSGPENSIEALSYYISGLKNSAYVSVYTFTSNNIASELVKARKRGVDVIVLVEDSPVGEDKKSINSTICLLDKNNVDVYLYKGSLKFIHAKYIIGDNSSVAISSGNFGPSSFTQNREWGAIIDDKNISSELLKVYIEDLKTTKRFVCTGQSSNFENSIGSSSLKNYTDQKTSLVIAPDAVNEITDFINTAKKSIYIEQFYIYKNWGNQKNPFLEAAINKARKGVDVKIFLDGNYYNTEKNSPNSNYNTAEYVNNISKMEKIPIEARLADAKKLGISTIHNKGVIVDGENVFISSINWNENSPRNNREIGVIVSGNSAAYFLDKFLDDWGQGTHLRLPSSRIIDKDYNETIMNVFLFIVVISSIMIMIKRMFYKRDKESNKFHHHISGSVQF